MTDTIVRGGVVVTTEGRVTADIRIAGERIVEIGPELAGSRHEIDARGLHVFPGLIDVHVHFNEPGRTEWEGARTGSHALAAGGGTMFFDMPLNSTPCTVTAQAVDDKRLALEAGSVADFAVWGGLVPGSVDRMAEMAHGGVVGFKAFMCDSGLPEFPLVDEQTLWDGMQEAARLALPVAVHAEDEATIRRCSAQMGGTTAQDFLSSRPVEAEVDAIARAVRIAEQTGAKLHVVHVSSGSGVATILEGRSRGADVSIETCPHYLFFCDEDLARIGVVVKCAPPLRNADERERLWTSMLDGRIEIVASDHSPSDPALKIEGDFRASWGGIAGVQSTAPVLSGRSPQGRRLRFERIAGMTAANPAARFNIPAKGGISVGNDADLMLFDTSRQVTLDSGRLLQRHRISPYLGYPFKGVVVRTIRRGETIFANSAIVATTRGKFIRPERQP